METVPGVEAFSDNLTVFDNNCSNHCPGTGERSATPGKLDRASNVVGVSHGCWGIDIPGGPGLAPFVQAGRERTAKSVISSRREQRLHEILCGELHQVIHLFANTHEPDWNPEFP